MSKGPLVLWLVMEFGWLCPIPAASEDTVRSFLGQSVTLPCIYSSWSWSRNSMCWGKGQCPKSKCGQELLHTDGARVLSSKSAKYRLRGNIQRGDVSLTISNTNEGDSGVYCCRIEVPGWFNDVKKHVRLVLSRAPTTTVQTTTLPPTTTPHVRTTTALTTMTAPTTTTAGTTPDLTTRAPLQTSTTLVLTTATSYTLSTATSLQEVATSLLTTGPSMEEPVLTTETFLESSESWESIEATSTDAAFFTARGSEASVLPSTSQVTWKMSDRGKTVTSLHLASEMTKPVQSKPKENHSINLVVIIACCVGLGLLALVSMFLLRGKVTKTNCLQRHKRVDNLGESKNVLHDMQQGQDDEDGLFTL